MYLHIFSLRSRLKLYLGYTLQIQYNTGYYRERNTDFLRFAEVRDSNYEPNSLFKATTEHSTFTLLLENGK